ncbi:FAST kinase domain-containing protein 5, mitochondrial isoform X2 [Cottoperca gobio]|uniref:FAST kinase domain-containing protein 5, mitochondrial isoform X2 n=1 Tax=Cottoperca gobio TaxID=56716 RepID=A0A6J2RY32_COTGO|nr:FAST kinase domain-containing protein 5, mitochondrial isoform X2 [Cottoperca gobio]
MSASVLSRRVPRLRYLQGLRKDLTKAQHVSVKQEDETDDHEEKKGVLQHQDASPKEGYRLYYNPSSYHHSVWTSGSSRSQRDHDEDEQCLSTLAPSFWQQSNRYSVSCLRHLSTSKNPLLDLAFNKGPEPEMPSISPYHRKPTPPDVKVNTRGFLKCRPEYASMTVDLTQLRCPIKWDEALRLLQKMNVLKGKMKPSDVSQFLAELSCLQPEMMSLVTSDQRFIMLLRYAVEHLRLFTELQLLDVLQSFVWLDLPSAHTVLGLFEVEFNRRADRLSLHQLMLTADLWRCIGRQVPQFLQQLYDSVRLHRQQIGVPELVHLLYIMGESRNCPKDLIHPLEQLLMRHLQQLLPEEVGAVCLGLFKSQSSLSEAAVTRVVDKGCSFVQEMSDFAVVNVLKFLRFSYLYHKAWLQAMEQEVIRRAPNMGVQGLMHVALACSALHHHNDNILMAIAEGVPPLVPHCRSKDSCKLLWALGTLGFLPDQSPSFYPSLTEALRMRKAEFQRYPEHLLTGLLGLAFVSQFPEDLITLALSPDFIKLALKSKQELKKDLFTLDEAVGRELPQWSGPRLSCELREEVTEMLWKFAQSDLCLKPEVREAESALQDLLGGEKFVRKRMKKGATITEDLLAQLMNNKNATEPLTTSPTVKPTSLHRGGRLHQSLLFDTELDLTSDITETLDEPCGLGSAPRDSKGTVKLAIQVSSRNHYCYHSQQLMGIHAMKRRHLKLAGYRVVELCHKEWIPMLRKSRAEKLAHMRCKVYNSLP